MSTNKQLICPVCGSYNIVEKNGKWHCDACELSWKKDEFSEEIVEQIAKKAQAESDLACSPPKFEDAESRFKDLCRKYPKQSAFYWGLLRAKYDIKYVNDIDNKVVPVCYSEYLDFRSDPIYQKCIQLAESDDLRNKYKSEANRIAETAKKFAGYTKNVDFDVFISFKSGTGDQTSASMLYLEFIKRGYKVFFSPETMKKETGRPHYDAYILNALTKSKVLIVYGSKAEYFESDWVKEEWTRYLKLIKNKRKEEDSLLVAFNSASVKPRDLPKHLQNIQAIDCSMGGKEEIISKVKEILNRINGSKIDNRKINLNKMKKPSHVDGDQLNANNKLICFNKRYDKLNKLCQKHSDYKHNIQTFAYALPDADKMLLLSIIETKKNKVDKGIPYDPPNEILSDLKRFIKMCNRNYFRKYDNRNKNEKYINNHQSGAVSSVADVNQKENHNNQSKPAKRNNKKFQIIDKITGKGVLVLVIWSIVFSGFVVLNELAIIPGLSQRQFAPDFNVWLSILSMLGILILNAITNLVTGLLVRKTLDSNYKNGYWLQLMPFGIGAYWFIRYSCFLFMRTEIFNATVAPLFISLISTMAVPVLSELFSSKRLVSFRSTGQLISVAYSLFMFYLGTVMPLWVIWVYSIGSVLGLLLFFCVFLDGVW